MRKAYTNQSSGISVRRRAVAPSFQRRSHVHPKVDAFATNQRLDARRGTRASDVRLSVDMTVMTLSIDSRTEAVALGYRKGR